MHSRVVAAGCNDLAAGHTAAVLHTAAAAHTVAAAHIAAAVHMVAVAVAVVNTALVDRSKAGWYTEAEVAGRKETRPKTRQRYRGASLLLWHTKKVAFESMRCQRNELQRQ